MPTSKETELCKIKYEKRGKEYVVVLSIGVQNFSIPTSSSDEGDALWQMGQLSIALGHLRDNLISLALQEKVAEVEKILQTSTYMENEHMKVGAELVLNEVIKILKQ